ncbi:lipoprotein N-acyltransferase Lnb [Mediterranea massiliensis]|uniref:lipoprotein N-acyltransferase Lnb n=1 Tax=Mediterranea massiliensis TaxID=1841865 RepID=UPI0025A3982D|nr:DUF4105 domain-containing protein [Mediterranea massiliensis]MDM8336686.1 DUF4105 domain-containing protein [Mediterranea massiliensis]
MKSIRHSYLTIGAACILFLFCLTAQGQNNEQARHDSIRFSLLTCGPGEEIYSLFGHTAIRYENLTRGIDYVFNYGIFSFNTPNFILRFTLGETDYKLGIAPFDYFTEEYKYLQRDVRQQVLNLNQTEKEKLAAQLEENYRPENRVYRYNFFYDNCATRPRDQIERATGGSIVYPQDMNSTDTGKTYRDLLHQYTENHLWSRFGMDLCMGIPADKPISRRQMMFVPFYLEECFDQATIQTPQGNRPLVCQSVNLVSFPSSEASHQDWYPSPLAASLTLFIIIALITYYGWRHQKRLWGVDLALFATAGLAGCILAFLALFSQHPAVSPNLMLFVFHPFHILLLPYVIIQARKGRKDWYLLANLVVLTLFILLLPVLPQKINLAVLPLALCLIVRSANSIIFSYKKNK